MPQSSMILISKPDPPSAVLGVIKITSTRKEGSRNSCIVFMCSRGMCIEPMGCKCHVTPTTGMHIIMLASMFAELGKKLVDAGVRTIENVKMSSRHF